MSSPVETRTECTCNAEIPIVDAETVSVEWNIHWYMGIAPHAG